eukprot:1103090-Amphidinium_carterae.1
MESQAVARPKAQIKGNAQQVTISVHHQEGLGLPRDQIRGRVRQTAEHQKSVLIARNSESHCETSSAEVGTLRKEFLELREQLTRTAQTDSSRQMLVAQQLSSEGTIVESYRFSSRF